MAMTKTKGVTAAIAAALLIATPFIAEKEGKRNAPYYDTVGVLTVCYGETRVPMKVYTDAQCQAMLDKALKDDFAPGVLACTPIVGSKPVLFASAISLSYNIGIAGYCHSTAARRFNEHKFHEGCQAYLLWNRPPEIRGRRLKERNLCLAGA